MRNDLSPLNPLSSEEVVNFIDRRKVCLNGICLLLPLSDPIFYLRTVQESCPVTGTDTDVPETNKSLVGHRFVVVVLSFGPDKGWITRR